MVTARARTRARVRVRVRVSVWVKVRVRLSLSLGLGLSLSLTSTDKRVQSLVSTGYVVSTSVRVLMSAAASRSVRLGYCQGEG